MVKDPPSRTQLARLHEVSTRPAISSLMRLDPVGQAQEQAQNLIAGRTIEHPVRRGAGVGHLDDQIGLDLAQLVAKRLHLGLHRGIEGGLPALGHEHPRPRPRGGWQLRMFPPLMAAR